MTRSRVRAPRKTRTSGRLTRQPREISAAAAGFGQGRLARVYSYLNEAGGLCLGSLGSARDRVAVLRDDHAVAFLVSKDGASAMHVGDVRDLAIVLCWLAGVRA